MDLCRATTRCNSLLTLSLETLPSLLESTRSKCARITSSVSASSVKLLIFASRASSGSQGGGLRPAASLSCISCQCISISLFRASRSRSRSAACACTRLARSSGMFAPCSRSECSGSISRENQAAGLLRKPLLNSSQWCDRGSEGTRRREHGDVCFLSGIGSYDGRHDHL